MDLKAAETTGPKHYVIIEDFANQSLQAMDLNDGMGRATAAVLGMGEALVAMQGLCSMSGLVG